MTQLDNLHCERKTQVTSLWKQPLSVRLPRISELYQRVLEILISHLQFKCTPLDLHEYISVFSFPTLTSAVWSPSEWTAVILTISRNWPQEIWLGVDLRATSVASHEIHISFSLLWGKRINTRCVSFDAHTPSTVTGDALGAPAILHSDTSAPLTSCLNTPAMKPRRR